MNIVTSGKVVSICSFHRREDKIPNKYSRVCSCHFSPMVQRFLSKIGKNYFLNRGSPRKKTKTETVFRKKTLIEMIEDASKNESPSTKEN